MTAFRTWIGAACVAACAVLLGACGGSGGGGGAGPGVQAPPPPPPPPPAGTAQVAVVVYDTAGRFVADAEVASAAGSATTDAVGRATLPVAPGAEQTVRIAKDGFAEQVRVLNLPAGATGVRLGVMLIAREAAQAIANIEAGGTTVGRHGVRVTFPAGALVDGNGQAVTGTVQVSMTPVDVGDIAVDAFPGLFEGVPTNGTRTAIVSYGAAELVPMRGGEKLALAPGRTAGIELPLYVTKHQDGRDVAVGDTIPLWSLDTATGVWRQEGTATVVASALSPTGLAGRATISHFSWWNLDDQQERATVNLTVRAPGETLPPDAEARVTARVVAGTGPVTTASDDVTIGNATSIDVAARATTRFEAVYQQEDPEPLFCRGSVDVSPAPDEIVDVTLDMTCVDVPRPRIVRPSHGTATNSSAPVSYQIVVDGPMPDSLELLAGGNVVAQFGPQFFYTGLLDTSAFPEGAVFLQPRAAFEGITRTGSDIALVIDRTAPQATTIWPPADEVVDGNTVFTVGFDEPVTAAPFTPAAAVRLSVAPPAGGPPIEVPIDIAFDGQLQQLTVQPKAALPLGTATLTWGGLHDAAGSAVAGAVAASWEVRRAYPIVDLPIDTSAFFAVANGPGGPVVVARDAASNLGAVRFDGSALVPFGPAINDRQVSRKFDVAIGGDGTVFVAFEQRDAGGTNAEVVVRRFDAAANAWQTVIAPLPVNRAFADNQTTSPALEVDAQNRPVLAFSRNNTFDVQAFRADGAAWTSLGTLTGPSFSAFSMVLNGAGLPVIAYRRGSFGSNAAVLEVVENANGSWALVGAALDSVPDATAQLGQPDIAIAPDGRPWVAWHHSAAGVRLARVEGSTWVEQPIDPALPSFNGVAGMTFVGIDPVVAGGHTFNSQQADLRRLRNGAWEPPLRFGVPGGPMHMRLVPDGNATLVFSSTTANVVRVTRVLFP